ncbi:armadillo repeat protein [Nannizzia gypsea CBS 118893]|uniref:Armadillo repeat protein n=1 Tax=Arthroderma gypseum (strain ATCC MYA-4604 / CBS 118893) TaxID=535722 RepID=E4UZ82_ARTGP|nr:armadillo repeat protein [Nannizzia gypsea CBS 118893]EFR03412.1 armadillo repeat protein [Nannizzia gypsea CBS 118893]
MTKVVSPQLLDDVRNADSTAGRIAALRSLKNDIIGHNQKKQAWTELGILPLLSDVLMSRRGVARKPEFHSPKQNQTEEDEMCFQAITIIGSLALGGPEYTSPILAGEAIPALLSILSTSSCPRSLALAVLQTLNTIADQLALVYQNVDNQTQPMGALLFTRKYIPTFRGILQQPGSSPGAQPCIELVADLISKTCSGEQQKSILAECGILDALGLRLATFIVAGGFVLPGAENSYSSTKNSYMNSSHLRVKEEAPAVLASLIMESRELQRYAVDSGAIKKLAQMLKESFGPTSEAGTPMWSATKRPATVLVQSTESDVALGPPGFTRQALSKIKYREAILKALAALALVNDDYRKAICDHGVVQHIIDSMKPWNPETTVLGNKTCITELEGNTTPVILAACAAARSLTRSVSVLRTSLIDAGIATPICALVKSSNIEIQIAATSVMCNLALDFSPMKEALLEANMVPLLCENSHSSNANLRIESLWSLKHISYNVPNKMKKDILEALGIEWIKQVLSHDPNDPLNARRRQEDIASELPSSFIEMGTSNSFGEQVDILNPVITSDQESESPMMDFDTRISDGAIPAKSPVDALSAENLRKRRLALNGDLDQTKKLRQDDTLAQEELFDLLRNIMCGPGAPDMIDYLLQKFGQTDFLDILASKLRTRPLPTSSASMAAFKDKPTASSHQKSILHPTEIIRAVTYVLIHIAAGVSRHRHLLVFHQDLLKLTMALLSHSNWQIRANCVWIVINLTLDDDKTDRASRVERAMRLKSLGVMERLSSLEIDSESDVRERTKTALDWMKALLGQ